MVRACALYVKQQDSPLPLDIGSQLFRRCKLMVHLCDVEPTLRNAGFQQQRTTLQHLLRFC